LKELQNKGADKLSAILKEDGKCFKEFYGFVFKYHKEGASKFVRSEVVI